MTPVAGTPSSSAVFGPDTLDQLEFATALAVVARHAASEPGAERVRRRAPTADIETVRRALATVAELAGLLRDGDPFRSVAVPDIRPELEEVAVPGSVLDGVGLVRLGEALAAMREVAAQLDRVADEAPRVAALRTELPPREVPKRFERSLEPDGSLKDSASPELARARQAVRGARERLVKFLNDFLKRLPSRLLAQDSTVTLRSGRYVVAVRREAKSSTMGIIHGESGSGATLFVEPAEAVALGNELNAAEAAEGRAVLQVLRELTQRVREHLDAVRGGWEMCVAADDLYARARYAVSTEAALPEVMAAGDAVTIRNGRHPLLVAELDAVVPFDLAIGGDRRVIVVSGPNTGGKTVLLKAVGLIAALAQAGVIPPVGEGTRLVVFDAVLSDIGDRQSLAESLSTFSGHLEALRAVLERAGGASLVLLDEFGTGTDPAEGAALAGAVLKTLCERGSFAIATTHLGSLKELAAETPGAVNASFEFDGDRLEPTYRLRVGVPGRSYGLAIARRLGFPERVMALAEALQPEAERSLDRLLGEVEERERLLASREEAAAAAAARLAAERDGLDEMKAALRARAEALDEEKRHLEVSGRAEARRFLLEARKRVDEALAKAGTAATEAAAKAARRQVEEGVREEASALKRLQEQAQKQGWTIRGVGGSSPGEAAPAVAARATGGRRRRAAAPATVTLATEIDLRGMTGDEAEGALVQAIDSAVVEDVPSLRIIHGKGTGALRERVGMVLQADTRVKAYATAPTTQGGWGVTIAEFGP